MEFILFFCFMILFFFVFFFFSFLCCCFVLLFSFFICTYYTAGHISKGMSWIHSFSVVCCFCVFPYFPCCCFFCCFIELFYHVYLDVAVTVPLLNWHSVDFCFLFLFHVVVFMLLFHIVVVVVVVHVPLLLILCCFCFIFLSLSCCCFHAGVSFCCCFMCTYVVVVFISLLFSSCKDSFFLIICMILLFVFKCIWFWFWYYLTRELTWHTYKSTMRPSMYFSLILKSRSNPFLDLTSTMQYILENNGPIL